MSSDSYVCGNYQPLTPEQLELFESVVVNLLGVTLKPLLVLKQTCVLTTYYFIAEQTTVTPNPVTTVVLIVVNVNCSGAVSLVSREPATICAKPTTAYDYLPPCPCNPCNPCGSC